MKLTLQETWSKCHQDPMPFTLPADWQLATHQWEVYQALNQPDVDIVFDTAMTGDGKTLAANLPMLRPQQRWNGVFIYPTNELIRDQQRQASEYQKSFDIELETQLVNGAEIAHLAAELELGKPDTLRYIFQGRPPLLLTNPDIFNLILNFAYTAKHENPSSMAERFINRYRYFVFDEFHTFDITQVNAILEAMLFIKASLGEKYKPKYLFLSATPSDLVQSKLADAGFTSVTIKGKYKHGNTEEEGYRKILQESSLEVESCENSTGGIYSWIETNLGRIRSFYHIYPGSKGAIICNSVFAAKRIYSFLKEELANDNIRIGENTGLTGKVARLESLEQDLVVATSTVDVGVDFRINLLIFESLDAGSFIQRLGRLGRHSGFTTYHAISLLPKYLCERFEKAFEDGSTVERPVLFESLRSNVFTETQQFASFIPRWGGVKAAVRWQTLKRNKHLQGLYKAQADTIYQLKGYHQAIARAICQKEQAAIYHELTSFRGAGLMDVWIHDPSSESVGSINILRLLSGATFKLIEKSEAEKIAKRLKIPFYEPTLKLYAQIISYLDERIPVKLNSRYPLVDNLSPLHQATQRLGFYAEAANPMILEVNKRLETLPLCTCAVEPKESVQSVKRTKLLPPFFELYTVRDPHTEYAVAFGQDALLLDSLIFWRTTNEAVII